MNEIFRRISVRCVQEQSVEGEKTELLLRAAMAAPSAGNQQPWEFYGVTDRMRLGELAACSPYADCHCLRISCRGPVPARPAGEPDQRPGGAGI